MDPIKRTNPLADRPIKALIFDLMGTCVDWHTSIKPVLDDALSAPNAEPFPSLGLRWRSAFFEESHARFVNGLPKEDIDETYRKTLLAVLEMNGRKLEPEKVEFCVRAWHRQTAWPDVVKALPLLKSKFDIIVLANGTTRLQIDIMKSAGLSFDMLLSSELLGLTKPDPAMYHRALELPRLKPDDCVMVAAHAYDLKAAEKVGMRTVYIRRWTEDVPDILWGDEEVRQKNDMFIDGREATSEAGGLLELVQMLGA